MSDERSIVTFLIFFSAALSIYGSTHYYIIKRGWQALPDVIRLKRGYLALSIGLAGSYILGRFLMSLRPGFTGELLIWIGSFWLSMWVYLFLMCLVIDIVRLADLALPLLPASWKTEGSRAGPAAGITVLSIALLLTGGGFVNSLFVRITRIDIQVPCREAPCGTIKLAVAADIHLGTVINAWRLSRIVDRINACRPDIVLLPGDIVDEGIHPEDALKIRKELERIRTTCGVYACAGNHEFITGVDTSLPFIASAGITVLRDETHEVAGCITLAGRDDVSGTHFGGGQRKALADILKNSDRSKPVVLMDHTPFGLDRAAENGVDLQVSGHTHNGQLFPFNIITGLIYEQDWGYLKKGDTHFYISCGAGTWGPPVRTNSVSEVVLITLSLKEMP